MDNSLANSMTHDNAPGFQQNNTGGIDWDIPDYHFFFGDQLGLEGRQEPAHPTPTSQPSSAPMGSNLQSQTTTDWGSTEAPLLDWDDIFNGELFTGKTSDEVGASLQPQTMEVGTSVRPQLMEVGTSVQPQSMEVGSAPPVQQAPLMMQFYPSMQAPASVQSAPPMQSASQIPGIFQTVQTQPFPPLHESGPWLSGTPLMEPHLTANMYMLAQQPSYMTQAEADFTWMQQPPITYPPTQQPFTLSMAPHSVPPYMGPQTILPSVEQPNSIPLLQRRATDPTRTETERLLVAAYRESVMARRPGPASRPKVPNQTARGRKILPRRFDEAGCGGASISTRGRQLGPGRIDRHGRTNPRTSSIVIRGGARGGAQYMLPHQGRRANSTRP